MKSDTVIVTSKIDPGTFYRFAVFDTLILRKRWISPAVFAGIFLVCSLICFSMYSETNQAELLGTVLLSVGLGVPAVYFGTFFHSLRLQSKALKLQRAAVAYTVTLTQTGIQVSKKQSGGSNVSFSWEQVFGVYERSGCVYLYVSPRQAFLLPEDCADVPPEDLREIIASRLKPEKIHVIK